MHTRVNVYVADVKLLDDARLLRINLSQLFTEALRERVEKRMEEIEHDAFMSVARSGSVDTWAS